MIVYCGDSYVWDDGKFDNWTNLLTNKLGMDSINLGVPGCSNEFIFQYQLINKVIPLLTNSPKIILYGITFPIRFYLGHSIHYNTGMDEPPNEKSVLLNNNFTKKEWDEYTKMRLHTHVFDLEYKYYELSNSLNIIADYLKSIGTTIKFFSTDCGHFNEKDNAFDNGMLSYGYFNNLKKEYWLDGKYIQSYTKNLDALGSNIHKYSNHFSKINNLIIAENIYKELKRYI